MAESSPALPTNDIPITVFNCTGRNDFMIVIFTKNEDPNALDTPFVAWHTIKVLENHWYLKGYHGNQTKFGL